MRGNAGIIAKIPRRDRRVDATDSIEGDVGSNMLSLLLRVPGAGMRTLVNGGVGGRLGGVACYHERVVNHYENPRNVGSLDKNSPAVGTGLVGAPACGDVMKFQIEVKDGKVTKAVFKTYGCGSAIASSSVATEWVTGKSVDECLKIQNTDIANHLNLPPVKLHCSMLAEDAIKAAITDYKAKAAARGNETPGST